MLERRGKKRGEMRVGREEYCNEGEKGERRDDRREMSAGVKRRKEKEKVRRGTVSA